MREASASLFDHDIPFVLFHTRVNGKEICIDARRRGNISRYIRYSCTPNAKPKIVILFYYISLLCILISLVDCRKRSMVELMLESMRPRLLQRVL